MGAASRAYEAVKDAWTWGRHETAFSPMFGFVEGLTAQVVGHFGTDLKGLDDHLKPHVAGLDQNLVQPTVANVMKIFESSNKQDTASGTDASNKMTIKATDEHETS